MTSAATASFSNLHPSDVVSTKEAAALYGVSPRTMHDWRHKGGGPLYLKISHSLVRYRVSDLLAHLAACERTNTAAA